ncbi:MAG: EAL domain-containing protein [Reinekea sp.]|nr:EAL domain-containing protein [Reinekea sp.]
MARQPEDLSLLAPKLLEQENILLHLVLDMSNNIQFISDNLLRLSHSRYQDLIHQPLSSLPLFFLDKDEHLRPFSDLPVLNSTLAEPHWSEVLHLEDRLENIFRMRVDVMSFLRQNESYTCIAFSDLTICNTTVWESSLFKLVFDESNEAILVTDSSANILFVNPSFSAITGYQAEEVIGYNPAILSSGHQDADFYKAFWHDLKTHGRWVGDMVNRKKSGEVYSEQLTVKALKDVTGNITNYVAIFSELTKKTKESTQDSLPTNQVDILTGLPKRKALIASLGEAIAYAKSHHLKLAVIYIDIDQFERINQKYSVNQGDRILKRLAVRIHDHIRDEDILSRVGGDEFILVLRDLPQSFNIEDFCNRLSNIISQPLTIDTHTLSVTASVGIAYYPEDIGTAEQLIRHAMLAMSLAKTEGLSQVKFYSSLYEKQKLLANESRTAVLNAIENQEMRLYVQPQYDATNERLYGLECLIRWQQDANTLIYPDSFLNSQKAPDLLFAVDQWVVNKVINLMQNELRSAVEQGLKVGINITTYSMQDPNFHQFLNATLSKTDPAICRLIEIEILEHDAVNNLNLMQTFIESLRPYGVTFSLDDFGTGYSSLSIFNQLDVETVKIDKSFVQDMLIDEKNLSLVKTICEMSKIYDRQTIAEGVEQREQATLLTAIGCHILQGYGIARPMPVEEFTQWQATQLPPALLRSS